MTANISKGGSYKELFARMDEASKLGFHLEASWIAYAVIEDRVLSALDKTGGVPTTKKGKPINMLGPKIKALRDRLGENALLRGAMLDGRVLDDVETWKEARNPLMHALAEEAEPWTALAPQAEELARSGERAARDLADAVSRLRAQLRKRR